MSYYFEYAVQKSVALFWGVGVGLGRGGCAKVFLRTACCCQKRARKTLMKLNPDLSDNDGKIWCFGNLQYGLPLHLGVVPNYN